MNARSVIMICEDPQDVTNASESESSARDP